MWPLAAAPEALHDHDHGPLTQFLGLPDSSEGATLLEPGRRGWELNLATASHSVAESAAGENLIFDGETTRLDLSYRRGLTRRFEIGVNLPYIWHESGGLDSLVDSWHDTFGLPGGFRDDRPNGLLEIRYADPDGTRVDLRRNVRGLGDARLVAGFGLRQREGRQIAFRLGIELPTGDDGDLLGSGGTDVSVGVAADYDAWLGRSGLDAFYRLNLVFVGEPALLADRYKDTIAQIAAGIGFEATQRLQLQAQASIRSAAYESALDTLGGVSANLTFGGHIRLSDRLRLSLSVSEDIKVESAPDVTLRIGLRYQ
jgi:hypothetical protein